MLLRIEKVLTGEQITHARQMMERAPLGGRPRHGRPPVRPVKDNLQLRRGRRRPAGWAT